MAGLAEHRYQALVVGPRPVDAEHEAETLKRLLCGARNQGKGTGMPAARSNPGDDLRHGVAPRLKRGAALPEQRVEAVRVHRVRCVHTRNEHCRSAR